MNNKSITISIISLAIILGVFGLVTKPSPVTNPNSTRVLEKKKPKSQSKDPLAFEYNGEKGPQNWAKLSDQYKECGQKVQSPIDIKTSESVLAQLPIINHRYPAQNYKIKDNGNTIVFTPTLDSAIDINGKKLQLVQFYFRIASEHKIDSKEYDMEIHFVHFDESQNLSIVGVFAKLGSQNTEFQKLIGDLPEEENQEKDTKQLIDINKLLPADKKYYNYTGSLTIPPCTEGVNWIIYDNPITLSPDQIEGFASNYDNNSRPVQKTNSRSIFRSR